eukprot:SAG31_NODE_13309_length_878_cov_1.164313_2_plen_71_part_01
MTELIFEAFASKAGQKRSITHSGWNAMLTAAGESLVRSQCVCGGGDRGGRCSMIIRLLTVLRLLARFSTAL